MRVAGLAVLAALLLSATGCYTTPSGKKPGLWMAMYPVNRVLDVADIVSVGAGPGLGLYGDVHATRAFQVGGGGGIAILGGWWLPRELGVRTGGMSGLYLGPLALANVNFARAGTLGVEGVEYKLRGWNTPDNPVYTEQGMDYWALGGKVVVGVLAASIDVHPTEMADALLGFVFVDFMEDDIGNRPVSAGPAAAPMPMEQTGSRAGMARSASET